MFFMLFRHVGTQWRLKFFQTDQFSYFYENLMFLKIFKKNLRYVFFGSQGQKMRIFAQNDPYGRQNGHSSSVNGSNFQHDKCTNTRQRNHNPAECLSGGSPARAARQQH